MQPVYVIILTVSAWILTIAIAFYLGINHGEERTDRAWRKRLKRVFERARALRNKSAEPPSPRSYAALLGTCSATQVSIVCTGITTSGCLLVSATTSSAGFTDS